MLFTTGEQLVPADTNCCDNLYQHSGGRTSLVANGTDDGFLTSFAGASADGRVVLFGTAEALVPADTDTNFDLYRQADGRTTLVSRGQINGNGDVGAYFVGASADASRIFFSTDERLVAGRHRHCRRHLPALPRPDHAGLRRPDQRQRRLRRHIQRRLERRPQGLLHHRREDSSPLTPTPPPTSTSASAAGRSWSPPARSTATATSPQSSSGLRLTVPGPSSRPPSDWSERTPTPPMTSTSAPSAPPPWSPPAGSTATAITRRSPTPPPPMAGGSSSGAPSRWSRPTPTPNSTSTSISGGTRL